VIYYRYWSPWRNEWVEYDEHKWWMDHEWLGYRRQKTQQERKRWQKDIDDGIQPRRRRAPSYLNRWTWLETYPTCYSMKSWKKIYRIKKQYQKNLWCDNIIIISEGKMVAPSTWCHEHRVLLPFIIIFVE